MTTINFCTDQEKKAYMYRVRPVENDLPMEQSGISKLVRGK